jgi:hypothetical protein
MESSSVRVIDMHNHIVAPEVVAFLEREGKHYDTRIIERDGKRFFLIRETALRPLHEKITQAEARLTDMSAEGIDIQAVSCVPFLMYPEVTPELGLAIAQVNKMHWWRFTPACRNTLCRLPPCRFKTRQRQQENSNV